MSLKSASVGVIVARFQVAKLHEGHLHLVNYVRERHGQVIIVLGHHGGVRTKRDPLTVEERTMMLMQTFPGASFTIEKLRDHPYSSDAWSKNLDRLLAEKCGKRTPILYGSRDSFIPYYSGRYETREVPMLANVSGTELRESLSFPHSEDARAAIIWDQMHRRDFMYSTSDLAIVNQDGTEVLLGSKGFYDGLYSFIGGHAEKKDTGARSVAAREGREEIVGIEVGEPIYIDTVTIQDPRYRGTDDGVMTSFYMAEYRGGEPRPSDDIEEVRWVPRSQLSKVLVPWHQPLGELLNAHLTAQRDAA